MSIFMGFFCSISMLLCAFTAPGNFELEWDFRLIPYLIGAVYGGRIVFLVLTAIHIALYIPYAESMWQMISMGLFLLVFASIVLLSTRLFQSASLHSKRRSIMMLMFIYQYCFVLKAISVTAYKGIDWTLNMTISLTIGLLCSLLAAWLSIYILESYKEKWHLHDEVRQISTNYLNEVDKLQQIIDETPFALLVVDREGKITHFNEVSRKLLNLRNEWTEERSLQGIPFAQVFQQEQGEPYVPLLHQALAGKKDLLLPYIVDNKTMLVNSFSLKGYSNSQIVGAVLTVQDITEISHLRDEVDRMERLSLVGQMAASITHEIRNPMAVIRGFVQLLQERSPKSQHEYFRIIMEELDRTNMIISDFLSLAQNRQLRMESASLHDIIQDILPLLHADANLRGQTISVDYDLGLPLLMLNAKEIKQLLLNLARNGMEAMGEKGVLQISTSCKDDHIELRITDNGQGIPSEQMKHLFEPFFTTKLKGTGLGLPLCLSIAERHNGRIDVESAEGAGTTFIVTFQLPSKTAGESEEAS